MDIPPVPAALPGAARATAEARNAADPDRAARQAAEAFEAVFLTEMLKHTGVNANPAGYGGGAGEEAFADLLTQEYARLLADRGGIGLAERIFEVITAQGSDG